MRCGRRQLPRHASVSQPLCCTPSLTSSSEASGVGTPNGSALPLVFQTAGAATEAICAALTSLEVEPSRLVVADDRRIAAVCVCHLDPGAIAVTSFATTSAGTRIAYETAGRPWRPALVFTHSLGSDHHMWASQVQSLKNQYFIVAIDNLGHGQSAVPAGDYSVSDFSDAVLAVAAAAELERFHYCGLSVGGLTGQWLGVHHHDRLLSLTLSNTAAKDRDTIGSGTSGSTSPVPRA